MEISVIEVSNEPSEPAIEKPVGKWEAFCQKCTPSEVTVRCIVAQIIALLLVYGTLWGLLEKDALPGSEIFAFILLVVCCYVGGEIVTLVKLPSLIGMLIVGFLFRNLPFVSFYEDMSVKWSSALRNSALVIILLRAGLSLDPAVLKKMSAVCVRLSFLPCSIEAVTTGLSARFLLGFPWALCFSLGFVLAAVSPAVVIPSMILLQEKGLGQDKGISTLIIASASVENVFAITMFGVCVGIAYAKGNLTWTLLKGPLEVIVGVAYGCVIGVLCWYFPHKTEGRKVFYRVIILTFSGLAATFMSQVLDFAAAGALGCISVAFIAALKWREEEDRNSAVAHAECVLWILLQTFLFGLIGAEVSIQDIQRDIGYGLLILIIGLVFRSSMAFLCVFGSGLEMKEKIFVPFAWLPKATVQAAIGSIALDLARSLNYGPDFVTYGKQILTIAVLSILFTAPLGAVAISALGPLFLHKNEPTETQRPLKDERNAPASYGSCKTIVTEGKSDDNTSAKTSA